MDKNLSIDSWGGNAWHLLHTIGLNTKITNTNKKDFLTFLNIFNHILPCDKCKNNFTKKKKNFLINEETLSNHNYQKWVYNIHNMVNDSIYKNKISFQKHIDLHKPFKEDKINNFSLLIINQLGNTPSFKDILECKSYLKYLIKLHPKNINNKRELFNELNKINDSKKLNEWYKKTF